MHFVIMGCGRVGASLARTLDRAGHTVAVVDQDPDAFLKLGAGFSGTTVAGVGFDREVLTRARAADAYAFAAVSSGDNSNILAARVARETFGVSRVVARIYDPRRAQAFERLGVPTVATVRWTADQIMRRLIPQGSTTDFAEPSGRIVIAEVDVSSDWIGKPVSALETAVPARISYLTRMGEGVLPEPGMQLQDGDSVHLACRREDLDEITRRLEEAPEDGSAL